MRVVDFFKGDEPFDDSWRLAIRVEEEEELMLILVYGRKKELVKSFVEEEQATLFFSMPAGTDGGLVWK